MEPEKLIDTIRRVATRLMAEKEWADVDLILDTYGFWTSWEWNGTKREYVINSLKRGDVSSLTAIDQYFMGHPSPGDEPWEDHGFRVFLSHVCREKMLAHELKSCLRFYGVDGFVAHEDIQPGKEWQLVIKSALHTCDALAGLLHEGFRESDWCDQEVGIALGRGVPVVPIHFELNPYGFFGSVQAVSNAVNLLPRTLARRLILVLLGDKRTSGRLVQAIVDQLADASSFDQANALSTILAQDAPLLSKEQTEQLRKAEKENVELQGSFDFDSNLSSIEVKIEATVGVSEDIDNDDAPF